MPIITNKISSKTEMQSAPAYASRMQEIVIEAVNVRRRHGAQAEAVFGAARDLRLSARRVTAFLRGEIGRVWADEYDRALAWHADFLARQAARSKEMAAEYERRAEALRKEIE